MKPFYIRLLSIIPIFLLGIIVYSNTFRCSFHFDDILNIADNHAIRNIGDLHQIWEFYPCRFLAFLSFAFNYHFNRLDVAGYHIFNLAIHLLAAILVWWLVLLTFSTPVMKKQKITRHAHSIALLSGLIFVSHPLQTESVTYIWQRAACMAAMFYLASLCFYVKSKLSVECEGPKFSAFFYICSLITAIAAMFTKENAITLPLMILLYEFCFFSPKANQPQADKARKGLDWRRLSPFLLCIFIIPLMTMLTDSRKIQEIQIIASGADNGISPVHYFLTQVRVMVTYIRLLVLPIHQNLDYDYPVFKSIFEWPVLFSFLFLSTILLVAKRLFSEYRLISFSIFWFFLTLLPESSFLPQRDLIVEHRLYLPLAGFSIFLVSSIYYLFQKSSIKTTVIILAMIITCNSILTYQRNKVWKDEFTLWDDSVKKRPHKARPYNNRGNAYFAQGRIDQAMSDYNKAIETDPGYAESYTNRGNIYTQEGRFSQAISDYNKAIELNPNVSMFYFNRGFVFAKQGNFSQALLDYNKTIDIDPGLAAAYNYRGTIYDQEGDFSQALINYNQSIELNSNNPDVLTQRGVIFAKQGNFNDAMPDFNKAIAINPNDANAYTARGTAYAQQGNLAQALSDYTKALEINPNDSVAYNNRAIIYNQLNKK